jgi:hypothetical protein
MWFLNPFYLAFASKPRVFAFGSRVVQGRGGAAQGLLDFKVPARDLVQIGAANRLKLPD